MSLNPSDGLLCYTDGSHSNKGAGGWAWVAVDAHGGQETDAGFIAPPTTNNRAEMYAQYAALNSLYESYGPCDIEIVSDSVYVVLGCQDPSRQRKANPDLWELLDKMIQLHRHVQWRHIRGHVGVKWNELADRLAVKARKEATWTPQ